MLTGTYPVQSVNYMGDPSNKALRSYQIFPSRQDTATAAFVGSTGLGPTEKIGSGMFGKRGSVWVFLMFFWVFDVSTTTPVGFSPADRPAKTTNQGVERRRAKEGGLEAGRIGCLVKTMRPSSTGTYISSLGHLYDPRSLWPYLKLNTRRALSKAGPLRNGEDWAYTRRDWWWGLVAGLKTHGSVRLAL